MALLFVPLDVTWPDNLKVIRVGLAGAGLHAMAMCLAKRTETDGVLHRAQLVRMGADDDLIDALVNEGLFDVLEYGTRSGEDPDRGYLLRIHDWHDRNLSQGAIDATRQARAESAKEGNHKRWNHSGSVSECAVCNRQNPRSSQRAIASGSHPDRTRIPGDRAGAECDDFDAGALSANGQQMGSTSDDFHKHNTSVLASDRKAVAPLSHLRNGSDPIEIEIEREIHTRATHDETFAAFWQEYPRKVDKKKALTAWRNLTDTERTDATNAISQHVKVWRDEKRSTDKIPHPTTWLHGRRWEDELAAAPSAGNYVYVDGVRMARNAV